MYRPVMCIERKMQGESSVQISPTVPALTEELSLKSCNFKEETCFLHVQCTHNVHCICMNFSTTNVLA